MPVRRDPLSGNKIQRRTEMVEMLVGMEALEGVVLTVLERVRNGKIEDAIACYAEEFSKDHGVDLEFKNKERLGKWRGSPADPSMIDALNCRKQPQMFTCLAYTPK